LDEWIHQLKKKTNEARMSLYYPYICLMAMRLQKKTISHE